MGIQRAFGVAFLIGLGIIDSGFAASKCCTVRKDPAHSKPEAGVISLISTEELQKKIDRFAPIEITAGTSHLSSGDREALTKIIEAAKLMDELFLRQVWSGNENLLKRLRADKSLGSEERLKYFLINKGPWSRLDKNEPFLAEVPTVKPHTASYYPETLTKEQFNKWLEGLSPVERTHATGYFHTIREGTSGALVSVPYNVEYKEFLEPASELLLQASRLTTNASLKSYLEQRANAFLSNDYYESDLAWMNLDSPIDLTMGPYETYEDELFGYKAAFEAFVTLRDDAETAKLAHLGKYLQEIEDHLPIDQKYKNPKIGTNSPLRVVDVLFTSGEANRGVQTAAFNLPNDERVTQEVGSKRVMLKNVQAAKFQKILMPISQQVLRDEEQSQVSFEAFFTHVLAHELSHGLGPQTILVGDRKSTVRLELKDTYSAIEEAKADITGLFLMQYMIDQGYLTPGLEQQMYTTYLTGIFRSVRFGITEAHGKGMVLQMNFLRDQGAIEFLADKRQFYINSEKIKPAVALLTHELLTLEATGDYKKAKRFLERYAVIRPLMQEPLSKMSHIPVDIFPIYSAVEQSH